MPIKLRKWLQGIWTGISKIFHKLDHEVKVLLPVAIGVVQNIKTFIDSPVADVITAIIPGDIDEAVKVKLREYLPKILTELALIDAIANIEDTNEQLAAILTRLKLSSDDAQNVFYHGLASLILSKISDGKLSWSDATAIAEYYYKHELNKP